MAQCGELQETRDAEINQDGSSVWTVFHDGFASCRLATILRRVARAIYYSWRDYVFHTNEAKISSITAELRNVAGCARIQ